MTPNNEELKSLAEFALTFTGFKKDGNAWLRKECSESPALALNAKYVAQDVLNNGALTCVTALIVMHLAMVELEKRGVNWEVYSPLNGKYICHIQGEENRETISHENKFIAFWMAVQGAIKNEEN